MANNAQRSVHMKNDQTQTTIFRLGLSKRAEARLDALMRETGDEDRAEVLRNALRLYEWVVEQTGAGHQIAAVKDGEIEGVLEFVRE
jgi:hypothetical protein